MGKAAGPGRPEEKVSAMSQKEQELKNWWPRLS